MERSQEGIRYTLSMERPGTHYFDVGIVVPPSKILPLGNLRFVMPVWTPGSYLIREFPRNVLDFRARQGGRELATSKEAKNVWIVIPDRRDSEISVSYRVYAHEFTVDTSFLDMEHGVANGASVFMYLEGRQNEESTLTVRPYERWKVISTGLEPVSQDSTSEGAAKTFIVPNYDILVDSPIEIGNQSVYSFKVNGILHEVSIFALDPSYHTTFVSDIQKIVENTWPIVGEIPYTRYVFLVDFSGGTGGGGLEHLNSTLCIATRLRLQPPEEYRQLLGLFSHEFFHAWNVKRMRPKGLGPFNYSGETYTKSLWVAEGITSYYDDLILRRANITSVGEYLDAFALNVNLMLSLPGPKWESAQEASFDTWIKFYRPDENSANVMSSYYIQGAVIGWMIDMEIRRGSQGQRSLDDVMKKIYHETYGMGRGYTDEEFENACLFVGGKEIGPEIFDKRVRGRERVDFDKYLSYAGLKLGPKSKPGTQEKKEQGFLGVKLKNEGGKTLVTARLFDSPAEDGGLSAGDEILGADGLRLDQQGFSFYLATKPPGTKMKLAIARNGLFEDLNVEVGAKPDFEYRIYKVENASDEQKRLFSQWMVSDWQSEIKYPEFTQFPFKRQIFDYV